MKTKILKILRIIGFVLIFGGIALSIAPMFKFDIYTFNTQLFIASGFVLPVIGIAIIIITSYLLMKDKINNNLEKVTEEEIAKRVKEKISESESDTHSPKVCKYCGCKNKSDAVNCKSCGANLK